MLPGKENRSMRINITALFLLTALGGIVTSQVPVGWREFYVAPNGRQDGDGSINKPWDLTTALSGRAGIRPGDTVWLRGGTYGSGGQTVFTSHLSGTRTRPIIIRQYPNERAIVDGSLVIEGGHTWVWGFEITNSNLQRRGNRSVRPTGLSLHGRAGGNKAINMIVHDAGQPGIGFWDQSNDGEVYGCIVWGNGYYDIDSVHGNPQDPWIRGDGLYSQNSVGRVHVTDSIWFRNFTEGAKAYAEGGGVKGFRFEGNISFENGDRGLFIATNSSSPNPLEDIIIRDNYVYQAANGFKTLHVGYRGVNGDAIVTGNYLVGADSGTTAAFLVKLVQNATVQNNTSVGLTPGRGSIAEFHQVPGKVVWDNNIYYGGWARPFRYLGAQSANGYHPFANWQAATGLDAHSTYTVALPTGTKVFVRPNKYEPGRGHIAIYNWDLRPSVPVDLSKIVESGSTFEIRDVQNYFGAPVLKGTYTGGSVNIPMNLTEVTQLVGEVTHFKWRDHTGPRFGAFVVLSKPSANPPSIAQGGVINAAGLSPNSESAVAPGSLFSIYGRNLTSGSTEQAAGLPLPVTLAGTMVSINGHFSPLYFVSPGQINAQIPVDIPAGQQIGVQIVVGELRSNVEMVPVTDVSPGIFAILGDGSRAGEAISIYGTGLGSSSPVAVSGYSASPDQLSITNIEPQVTIAGQSAKVIFSGLAPGFVGVNQVNAIIPDNVPAGRAEVFLQAGSKSSNAGSVLVTAR
jgi:uncharacterized protein (TIGR03437 family)